MSEHTFTAATYELIGAGGAVIDTVRIRARTDQPGAGLVECSTGLADATVREAAAAYRARGLPLGDLDGYQSGQGRLVWAPTVPSTLLDLREAGSDRKLRAYWVRGVGAAKIDWGTGGDFKRCVSLLSEHVSDPEGLCNTYHQDALGAPPGKGH